MAGTYDFTWDQGDDLNILFIYNVGADVGSAVPVDLTGYQFRMDMATLDALPTRVVTLNSDDITGSGAVDNPGSGDNEVTLGDDGSISIFISRSLTLTGGAIFTQMGLGKVHFKYDCFLRSPGGLQHKILSGTININSSVTQWL